MNRQKKKRKSPVKITQEQLIMVHNLADKGVSDGEIAEQTGVNLSVVQLRTTRYWELKMAKRLSS